ncbi:MAG: cation-translocating P-type ATPase [Anaerolineae bacterium]|nr:cation-translocating P-type ATPase [Anaerolineae bacterium]
MTETIYRIEGMDCANCAREVEAGVSRLPGVRQVQVDFATAKMRLEGDVDFQDLKTRVESLGKQIQDASVRAPAVTTAPSFFRYLLSRRETRMALIGAAVILLGLVVSQIPPMAHLANGVFVLATIIALIPIARSGLNTLLINRDFNINLLMTVAAVGAIFIGETLEAATVVFLFAVGEALEGYTADRARDSLRSLMSLVPATALRIRRAAVQSAAGSNFISLDLLAAPSEETVSVDELVPDDVIRVKPGERIPMDGLVTAGNSGVNQAPITGESIPVDKATGAEVFAGTINGEGALDVRVTRRAVDNTLNRIIAMVEEAQSVRAPSQRLIDRFAHYYTPGVMVLAVLVALIPPLLFAAPFYDLPDGTQGWLYRALELLVIACPCSLVISTPVTIISAITAAARRGVLIKGGAYLEALGGIKAFAFDKTGTLTQGQPAVTQIRSIDCDTGESCDVCDDVLALASAVERSSAHPLAKAVVNAAQVRGINQRYTPAEAVTALAGQGVQGRINGKLVTIGSHSLFDAQHPHQHELCDMVDAAEANGQTTMLLSDGDRVRGFIALADQPRAESQAVVHELHGLGMQTVMLTGDNAAVAKAVGQNLGVDDVRAGLLPADKVDAVKQLVARYGTVAMVGDGINDTPALAAATLGIAMGGAGSAQALETADIALMADDLRQLPYALRLARFARQLIRQNIAISISLKLAVMLLALAGGGTLWLAVFADVGMSLLVTANGMRPLRFQSGRHASHSAA